MPETNLRILVSNDDGINAPGLVIMEKIARTLSDDVWVVAPETEQSGASHSISIRKSVRITQAGEKRFFVSGTPTDCVVAAHRFIVPEKIDLVLSGVNRGPNVADDVTHSGTVAAAMEGALSGIRSFAFSMAFNFDVEDPTIHWETAEAYGPDIARKLLQLPPAQDLLYNINFPDCAPSEVKGIKCVAQGKHHLDKDLTQTTHADGKPEYWVNWSDKNAHPRRPDVDIYWIGQNYVTVTPLTLDLTHYETLNSLKQTLES